MEVLWWQLLVPFFLTLIVWWWNDVVHVLPVLLLARGSSKGPTLARIRLPPGCMGLPFIGEMLSFHWYFSVVRRPDDFINSKRKRYGNKVGMYRTHLFGCPSIIACSSSVNKFVFHSNDDKFRLEWPTREVVGMNSLIALEGDAHDRLRAFLMAAVNRPQALRHVFRHAQPRMATALRLWARKGRINTYHEIKKVTFENIANYFVSFEGGPHLEALEKLCVGLSHGFRAQPSNIPGTTYHRALQCRKKLNQIFREELHKRRTRKEQGREEEEQEDDDLMGRLMRIKVNKDDEFLSDDEVLDNIISLLYTAYHSIAHLITWSLYFLAKSPHVLQKLREENVGLSKESKEGFIAYEDVAKLKYTNKVVEETIRMANLSAFVFRTAIQDVEFEGYTIPKGWKVILWIRYLHTDPDNFEDPLCFNPERWDNPPKPGSYLVFGGGTRLCPGNMLVRLNLAVFLHHLAINYKYLTINDVYYSVPNLCISFLLFDKLGTFDVFCIWELLNPNAKTTYLSHPIPEDGLEIAIDELGVH